MKTISDCGGAGRKKASCNFYVPQKASAGTLQWEKDFAEWSGHRGSGSALTLNEMNDIWMRAFGESMERNEGPTELCVKEAGKSADRPKARGG